MARVIVVVLCLLVSGARWDAVAASRARVCRRACGEVIAGCIADGGRPRACRRATIRRCKRQGTSTCLVVAASSTTSTSLARATTTVATTSSTTSTTQPQGLYGLLGTWDFTYSITSTYHDRYVMSSVRTSSDGVPYIAVYDVYDGVTDAIVARPVDLGLPSPYEFALLDASSAFCDFFLFDKTGANAVGGSYYLTGIDFDGSCGDVLNPSDPYPMTGVRTAAALTAGVARDDGPPLGLEAVGRAMASLLH